MSPRNVNWKDYEDACSECDMVMTCRGQFVFAWSSADLVVHIYDCETHLQRSRIIEVDGTAWGRPALEVFADEYLRDLTPDLIEPQWSHHRNHGGGLR